MLILPYREDDLDILVSRSIDILSGNGIIAYLTESFYALGGAALSAEAVQKVYTLKERQRGRPLPVIVGDMDTLRSLIRSVPSQAEVLMERYWPGALTMIFEARDHVPDLLTGGSRKVAARIPGPSPALRLAQKMPFPITATSANVTNHPPAEDVRALVDYFGDSLDLIIDGGTAPGGKPSTIVDLTVTPPRIVRKGSVLLDVKAFMLP